MFSTYYIYIIHMYVSICISIYWSTSILLWNLHVAPLPGFDPRVPAPGRRGRRSGRSWRMEMGSAYHQSHSRRWILMDFWFIFMDFWLISMDFWLIFMDFWLISMDFWLISMDFWLVSMDFWFILMEFDRFRWFFVVLFCLFEWILMDFGWAATCEVGGRFFFGCVHLD